jgi:hypothetical protein
MAYDQYSRGDNPWLGNLDMPRSNPTAKPGASRAASLSAPAKKKKPAEPTVTGSTAAPMPPRRPTGLGGAVPLPPIRPEGLGEWQGPRIPAELRPASQPSEGPYPPPPPRILPRGAPAMTPGTDAALAGANPPVVAPPDVPTPNIPGGILGGGATPAMPPMNGNTGAMPFAPGQQAGMGSPEWLAKLLGGFA